MEGEEENKEEGKEAAPKEGVHQGGASTSSRPSDEGNKDSADADEGNDNKEEQKEDVQSTDESRAQKDNELTDSNNSEPIGAPKEGVPSDEGKANSEEEKKEGSWTPMIVIMALSMVIVFSWDKVPFIKDNVHRVLDPSAGALLNWNLTLGMLAIIVIINIITTIIQKYATDQEALRELKKEQKILQAEMKKYKDHPEKVAELSKKQMQFIPKTMKLTSRAIAFTGVPFILFFRWFNDIFTAMELETGVPVRFLGFLSWFWFYLIFTMVFSGIFRKMFKVV